MLVIRFGKWCHKSGNIFCYDRVYTNRGGRTPFCVIKFRHVGQPHKPFNLKGGVFIVSRYGDYKKDNLSYEIDEFLESHSISELLEIVAYCVEIVESEKSS